MKRKTAVFVAVILGLAALIHGEYSQTAVYFNVPVKTSFTVTLPLSDVANASGVAAPPGATATADLNFSSEIGTVEMLQPCLVTVFGGACQDGPEVPIFMYKNTGNVNISMWLEFNNTLPNGVAVGVNSTRDGSGNNAVVHSALYSVNASAWVEVFQHLKEDTGFVVNVTLYTNFTGVDGLSIRLLMHNSTMS
jgi:hypothetical protein